MADNSKTFTLDVKKDSMVTLTEHVGGAKGEGFVSINSCAAKLNERFPNAAILITVRIYLPKEADKQKMTAWFAANPVYRNIRFMVKE